MRRCCETTSCCQACGSPAMHWRTSLLTASCSACCSGVRCNLTSRGLDGGRSVPRWEGIEGICCGRVSLPQRIMGIAAGAGPDRAGTPVDALADGLAEDLVDCRLADWL